MRVVISQSMYFPWVGLLEQLRLADVFVHYDDVQFTRGFYNRVQVKTVQGTQWLTVPLRDQHRGQTIDEVLQDDRQDWQRRHAATLRQHYSKAPFRDEMLEVASGVLLQPLRTLADVSRASILALAHYFGLAEGKRFVDNGKVITTAGVTAGIDGALRVVERLLGKEAARWTAEEWMEHRRDQPTARNPER